MDWTKIIWETVNVSWATIFKMLYVVIPLLIFIECLKDTGWLEKIAQKSYGITKLLKLPGEAGLAIIVGLFAGLLYGSGVMLQLRNEMKITRFQLNILFIFIGICHAIIEETILFTSIGAYGGILIINRIFMAVAFSFLYIWITQLVVKYLNKKEDSADSLGSQQTEI
ncbi:MAG: nucleoside recognition domain-containing protein [Clostridia bacterium]